MPVATASIAARLWIWAGAQRLLKHILPLESLVRLMHRSGAGAAGSRQLQRRVEAYLSQTGRFPRRPPSNCLERSLGVYRLLCGGNLAPRLVVGFRRGDSGGLLGHVWVMVDRRALGEDPARLATYTSVIEFDADGRRAASSGGPENVLADLRFN
jgi:hypothetical protein